MSQQTNRLILAASLIGFAAAPCLAAGAQNGGAGEANQGGLGTGSSTKSDAAGSGSTLGNGGAYTGSGSTGAVIGNRAAAPEGNTRSGGDASGTPQANPGAAH